MRGTRRIAPLFDDLHVDWSSFGLLMVGTSVFVGVDALFFGHRLAGFWVVVIGALIGLVTWRDFAAIAAADVREGMRVTIGWEGIGRARAVHHSQARPPS